MKTTILTITPIDDIYSIQDKLSWNKSGRVLLVLEGKNPLFQSRKELSLLLRSTKNTGSQIGIVTESRAIRTAVKQYGIPVFADQQEAMRKGWTVKGDNERKINEEKRLNNLKNIQDFERKKKKDSPFSLQLGIFFIAVLAVISLVLFFLPGARIQFNVNAQMQAAEIPVNGSTDISETTISGMIPVYTKELELTLSDHIDCSGNSEVPVSKATGHVLVQNLTDNEIFIPMNTIFSSSKSTELRFQSLESATLPAGVNETIQLPVEALIPGIDGNIEAEGIDAVEGNLGLFVTVTNQESFTGGENQISSTPTQSDFRKLQTQLRNAFLDKAAEEFTNEVLSNEIFIPDSVRINEITNEEMEPAIGLPSEVLKLSQEAIVEGWFIKKSDVERVLKTVMDSQLPESMVALQSDLIFESTGNPTINKDEISWRFVAGREIIQVVEIEDIPNIVAGKPVDEAKSILVSMGYADDQVDITISPSWWKRMPFLENNIKVKIVE